MVDLGSTAFGRTPRQRGVLLAGSALLFAWGVGISEPRPVDLDRGIAVTVAAALAIFCWSFPYGWSHPARFVGLGFAGVALYVLNPRGPGEAAVFAAVALAEVRLPERASLVISIAIVTALELALALKGASAVEMLTTVLGLGLLFVAMASLRRSRFAVERARKAELEAAVADERGRLAREIHDVLAHSLTALVVQLDGAQLLAEKKPDQLPAALERARHLVRSGLDEARQAIGALRGDTLPGPDLLPTLVSDFETESNVPIALDVTGRPIPLSSEARLAIYRTAQEALTNIRKHAHPKSVHVTLTYGDRGAELLIEDRGAAGQSFRSGHGWGGGGGYGLNGMRERAELAGGKLEAGPTDTGGFKVRLWLPA